MSSTGSKLEEVIAQVSAEGMAGAHPATDTVPLPLPPRVWIDDVFAGHATAETMIVDILGKRGTALFYKALFSLDDETRAWLAEEPSLIREIVERFAAPFAVAAPGLRVSAGRVRPPGGDAAAPGWEAIVGRPTRRPGEFLRALLAARDGRLAYFIGAMAALSEAQVRFGLRLDAEPDERVDGMRRLARVFERIAGSWNVDEDPFRRPALDPALLLADLGVDDRGEPILPGSAGFWRAVLAHPDVGSSSPPGDAAGISESPPVEFPSLCEQLLARGLFEYRRGHLMVLFASRVVKRVTPSTARDAIEAVRAAAAYPALTAALERAGVDDVAVFAQAARRAAGLSRIDDEARARRSIAQFQGAIFLVTRAALRGAWPARSVAEAVSSAVAVEPGKRGDYEGRLVQWLAGFVEAGCRRFGPATRVSASTLEAVFSVPGAREMPPFELDVLHLMAGERDGDMPTVQWEGSQYRVDFATAEAIRLARWLGDHPRPYLSAAKTLVELGAVADTAAITSERVREQAAALERLRRAVPWEPDVDRALRRAAASIRADETARPSDGLRLLADDLFARGLTELAYAVALGDPERSTVSAGDVSQRHDFGLYDWEHAAAWDLATSTTDDLRGWRLRGSILGLDLVLGERALVGVSSRPPSRAPSIDPVERRAFAQAVVLIEPAALTDADMRTIVAAIRRGRERVAAVRTPDDVAALASEIRLGPERVTLLRWAAGKRPGSLPTLLSPLELFWLGLGGAPIEPGLHAWGASVGSRTGCHCLHLNDPHSWEAMAGRWSAAVLASDFPDLNLRLAELLVELHMPASLLASVLAAATLDLVNTAHVRDRHDRRGLEAFVRGLRLEDVEQYLALLTTGGPLVPLEEPTAGEQLAPFPEERR